MRQPDPSIHPAELGPSPDSSHLRIRWGDDHVSDFPPRYLRITCPCAGCVDEFTGERILDADSVPEGIHPLAIHYVGRYAIRFDWSDGHGTGIFPFDYLRRLCPCPPCGADRPSTPSHPSDPGVPT